MLPMAVKQCVTVPDFCIAISWAHLPPAMQILKSEKRNDGLWYYRIHYNVRLPLCYLIPGLHGLWERGRQR